MKDADDHPHNHLLESFGLLPEELGPISLIVRNTVDLKEIIFDDNEESSDDHGEGEKKTDDEQDNDTALVIFSPKVESPETQMSNCKKENSHEGKPRILDLDHQVLCRVGELQVLNENTD